MFIIIVYLLIYDFLLRNERLIESLLYSIQRIFSSKERSLLNSFKKSSSFNKSESDDSEKKKNS